MLEFAYGNGDLSGLRLISAMVTEPVLPEEKPDAISQLIKEKERLLKLLQSVKDRIAEIKSDYPFTMKSLVQNPEKCLPQWQRTSFHMRVNIPNKKIKHK